MLLCGALFVLTKPNQYAYTPRGWKDLSGPDFLRCRHRHQPDKRSGRAGAGGRVIAHLCARPRPQPWLVGSAAAAVVKQYALGTKERKCSWRLSPFQNLHRRSASCAYRRNITITMKVNLSGDRFSYCVTHIMRKINKCVSFPSCLLLLHDE